MRGFIRRQAAAWLLVPAMLAAAERAADPILLRKEAVARYQEGRYDEAVGLFQKLAATMPDNAGILRDLMWALWRAEKYADAGQTARRLKEIRPGDPDAERVLSQAPVLAAQRDFNARRERAVDLYRQGRYGEAASLYEELTAMQPGDAKIRKDLMWSLWQAGRMEDAERAAAGLAETDSADEEIWNLRGDALLSLGRKEESLAFYEKSLKKSPRQPRILMALGRLYEQSHDYQRATEMMERVKRMSPGNRQVYAPLARIQFTAGDYAGAAANWRMASQFFPQRTDYALNEARALYQAGKLSAALNRMRTLAEAGEREAVDFLIDDAWASRKWDEAEKFLEKHKGAPSQENEGRWMKLISLYQNRKKEREHRALLDQFLAANPEHDRALMMKAQLMMDRSHYRAAMKIYGSLLRRNPWHKAAMTKLAEGYGRLGEPRKAMELVRRMRGLDPTDPSLLLLQERYMHESGDSAAGRDLLLAWLENNQEPALPVLLYHGLSSTRRDPMLAHPVHMPAETFAGHMRSLHQAGYTPVTAAEVNDWIHRNRRLPARPILITFDDGRVDSFRHADPILKKYGLKATMYSCLVNMEGHRPTYAPWPTQQAYARTGRWEIESHGDLAHTRVPSGEGRAGLFLLNRLWDPSTGNLETEAAWKKRVSTDYEDSKRKIRENMGVVPVSFAFPEGDYGQQSVPNNPDAARVNIELVRKSYGIAFYQDEAGVNVRSRNPALLTRLEPPAEWSGEELVEYLRAADPFTRVYRSLLKQALWQGHTHEASRWLKELRARGAPESIAAAEEGRIRFHTGDTAGGYDMSRRSLGAGRDPETSSLVASMEQRGGVGWTPSMTWQNDKEEREARLFHQTVEIPLRNGQRWTLAHRVAVFSDRSQDQVRDHAGGLRWRRPVGLFHAVTLGAMGHSLSDGLGREHELSAHVASKWTDRFSTEVEAARVLYDTARALRAGVAQEHAGLLLRWSPERRWRASLRGRLAELSDKNRRRTGQADLSRALDARARWKIMGRFTYDDMRDVSPSYYSPRRLREGLGGLEYSSHGKDGQVTLRALAGSGREERDDPAFVREFEAEARLPMGPRTSFGPIAVLSRTPRYWRNTFGVALYHRFGA